MTIQVHDLNYAEYLRPALQDDKALHLIKARGRATRLEVPAGWCSVWMPLFGGMRVRSPETTWNLASRDLLIWCEGAIRSCGRQPSWFVVLCGPPDAWRPYLSEVSRTTATWTDIYPAHGPCPREVRRLLVHLARLADRTHSTTSLEDVVAACCSAISENQGEIRSYLARCNGRTADQRRNTLLRLLRVRHLITNSGNNRIDLPRLSRIANYSPWHLTRAYREVFGETPSEHAIKVRLRRAMDLVCGTNLTVREICDALGFESASTFCRYFKRAYGVTTTQARSGAWRQARRNPISDWSTVSAPYVGSNRHAALA